MSMAKKNYDAMARIIRLAKSQADDDKKALMLDATDDLKSVAFSRWEAEVRMVSMIAHGMANEFKADNRRFDYELFYQACGLSKFYRKPAGHRQGEIMVAVLDYIWLFHPDGTYNYREDQSA